MPQPPAPGHPSDAPVTVAIVDDHPTTRAGTRSVLTAAGLHVSDEAASLAQTRALLASNPPRVLVLDLNLTDGNALRHLAELCALAPGTQVLVLTMHDELPVVRAALDAGAAGYLLKLAPTDELVTAVTTVARGGSYLQPGLAQRLARPSAVTSSGPLSPREQDALRLWADGHTNSSVAEQLHLSVRSVERLRASLASRLSLTTRADFARYTNTHLR